MRAADLTNWHRRCLWAEAATLAFMKEGPYDIRPALLLLFHAGDTTLIEDIFRHGTSYVAAYAARKRIGVREEVCRQAAADALAIIWARRAPEPVAVRSRELRIRNSTFYELRTAALRMYRWRLHEARVRFASGTIYTRQTLSLERELEQPQRFSMQPVHTAVIFDRAA